MNSGRNIAAVLLALAAMVLLCACRGGWHNEFAIDGQYAVLHFSNGDDELVEGNGEGGGMGVTGSGGRISEIGWNDDYIVLHKRWHAAETFWEIVDRRTAETTGPLNEDEFALVSKRCGADRIPLCSAAAARQASWQAYPLQAGWKREYAMTSAVLLVLGALAALVPLLVAVCCALRKRRVRFWLWAALLVWLLPAAIYFVGVFLPLW